MDGPIRLGGRTVSIEFKDDRHSTNRIELAYRLVETLATINLPKKSSEHVAAAVPLAPPPFASEMQG